MSAPILAEILHADLPAFTALRAARERGQVLQSNARHSVIAPRLLRGFTALSGGADITRAAHNEPTPLEAA
jgi:hypothetical protein